MVAHLVTSRAKTPRAYQRLDYYCGSYHRALRGKWPKIRRQGRLVRVSRDGEECHCGHFCVRQEELDTFLRRYLDETGQRLQTLLYEPQAPTGRLEEERCDVFLKYVEGLRRLTSYLAQHQPDEWARLCAADRELEEAPDLRPRPDPNASAEQVQERARLLQFYNLVRKHAYSMTCEDPGPGDRMEQFLHEALAVYTRHFDPAKVQAEVQRLRSEYDKLVDRWADLPTPRAKEHAKAKLVALEAQIAEMEKHEQDLGDILRAALQEFKTFSTAIAAAQQAMASETGERALRQRAAALRAVIHRIECHFVATGGSGKGRGNRATRLSRVTIYPLVGDSKEFRAEASNTLQPLSFGSPK
jgi:hypothetical protein